jgi:hypothetical protein
VTRTRIRILCDRSVLQRYVDIFNEHREIEVMQSEDIFSDDAPDREISAYAAEENWVVFAEDDDFLGFDHDRGLLLYHHIEQPSPVTVVEAVLAVADVYDDHRDITEYIPGEWV